MNKENAKLWFYYLKDGPFRTFFLFFCLCFIATSLSAQEKERFAVEFEGKLFWQTRNDVRIPNETGTEFSLVDTVGKGPYGAFRAEAAFDVSAKLAYALSDPWELAFGYRTIEGGADVEQVYNFAWIHFSVGSIRFRL